MRDFRDAKAMAQTLRDVLKPKTALTRSESLEAIAKILGFQVWNVLAAKIQSDASPPRRADLDNAERQEIRLEGATLDVKCDKRREQVPERYRSPQKLDAKDFDGWFSA